MRPTIRSEPDHLPAYAATMTDPSGLPYCLTRRNPDTGVVDSPT